jgi:hypothetical protein
MGLRVMFASAMVSASCLETLAIALRATGAGLSATGIEHFTFVAAPDISDTVSAIKRKKYLYGISTPQKWRQISAPTFLSESDRAFTQANRIEKLASPVRCTNTPQVSTDQLRDLELSKVFRSPFQHGWLRPSRFWDYEAIWPLFFSRRSAQPSRQHSFSGIVDDVLANQSPHNLRRSEVVLRTNILKQLFLLRINQDREPCYSVFHGMHI